MKDGWSSATSSSGHHSALCITLRHLLPANSLDTHSTHVRLLLYHGCDSVQYYYLTSAVCPAGAAIVTTGEFGTTQNYSLFDNITCSSTALEHSLGSCEVNIGTCLTTCTKSIGIRCFGKCVNGIPLKVPVFC